MREHVNRISQRLQKLSPDQVKNIFKSVVTENEMLDSILESLSTGLIVVNMQWKILKINKIAERYLTFGYHSDEQKRDSAFLWEIFAEPEIAEFLKTCAKEKRSNTSEEFTISDANGSTRFLTVSIFSFVHEGQMRGNIVKIYDTTENKKAEIRLRRMESMASLTNLAAGMAHEIKNPLGAISIHIQLIQKAVAKQREKGGMLPEKKFLEDHLDVVNEEIEDLNRLVMDFLFAVRPVNADLRLVNPLKILENIVVFFKPEINRFSISLDFDGLQNCPKLLIDEKLFREAIVNLLQNSLAAIKERYPECSEESSNPQNIGTIFIKVKRKDDKILFLIADNGAGMSDETVSKIFEPYFTTKANGTGLGMTMVYKIIKEFSGEIQVKSELGKGTVCTIFIPIPQTDKKLIVRKEQ
ncbi:MAG: PAS domain S-box protein [Treponema sp.]|nr:PAS domain S-box protein [Treponema sp.]MBD5443548.1 PAS domain S-box protein [Treponema sp.]